jgi:hypothetical protein
LVAAANGDEDDDNHDDDDSDDDDDDDDNDDGGGGGDYSTACYSILELVEMSSTITSLTLSLPPTHPHSIPHLPCQSAQ